MKITVIEKDNTQRQIINVKSLEIDKFGIIVNFNTTNPSWEMVMLPHGRLVNVEND